MSTLWRWLYARTRGARFETYETTQPWVCYTYFVPDWVTRLLGRISVRCECCICGEASFPTMRIPRWGAIEDVGPHPARTRFLAAHLHPHVNQHPHQWERPLRNPAVLRGGDLEDVLGLAVSRARRAATDEPTP